MADAVFLSRLQFAFTVGYHILWPAYTIGVGGFIAALSTLWLTTRNPVYRQLLRFWIHLFALGFAMGVVTGLVLSYQIGTNWSVFAERTSNVIGPFFTYEVLVAFFLEAGFVGIMLYGLDRVGPRLHSVSCSLVAIGTVFSAFWILAANSWMQTPAGFSVEDGTFHIEDWMAAIFTPSFPYRFAHMVVAGHLTGTFVVIGILGWYLWRREHREFARTGFSMAMWAAAVLAPLQIFLGDLHGLNTRDHQPVKVAAMEARWETAGRVPFTLFAWPDMEQERNRWAVDIPAAGSLVLTHSTDGVVLGLKAVPPDERPYVPVVFWAFRIMLACGLVLLAVAWTGLWLRWRGRLYDTPWFSLTCVLVTPLGFIAILAGWTVTEVGRQPWVVYGHLRTADAVSPIAAGAVAGSLTLFVTAYAVLLLAFFWYGARIVLRGPRERELVDRPLEVRPGLDSAPAGSER